MTRRVSRPALEELEGRSLLAASLVADIFPGSNDSDPAFTADYLTNVNGTLFFTALDNDVTHGRELWKSDGTAAGTVLVKDINPGFLTSYSRYLTNVNGTLFFRAYDGTNGYELWKSDGTAAGTVLVKDINPGSNGSNPDFLTNVNGTLFFRADDGTNGFALWKSDGTAAGTTLVKNVSPGAGSGSTLPSLTNVNGILFFTAIADGANGVELWKSDGTAAGTVLVKDINPGSNGSNPDFFANVNGTLFFRADDGTNGYALWRSDGTATGTALVRAIDPASNGSATASLTNVNGTLFFRANDGVTGLELWKSDGTAVGTTLVKDINPGAFSYSYPFSLTNVNGKLFFVALDDTNGFEVWTSDGTEAGTVLVKDINPGSGTSYPRFLTNVNGTLFFTALDDTHGYELWQSDGTEAGTVLVEDINPGIGSSSATTFLTNVNGTLFFQANDGTHGYELWTATTASGPTDTTAPSIAGASFTGITTGTFDKVTLTFSEPMQGSTVNTTNITLTGPSGTIGITNIAAVAGTNNTKFDVTFASQNAPGDYTLNAAASILDLAGNSLLQPFTVTRTLTSGGGGTPFVAVGGSDGSVRILDGDTGQVLVPNFRPLDGATQYKSTVAVALGDLDGDGTPELFVAAQKRAGVAGLDASKAGKVFVFNVATVIDTGSTTPFDTITPFAKNFDGTQTYETGFELATGDVNGDSTLDLIAASRGDVGQISVMSGVGTGTGHARLGSIVTPFGTNYRGKVTVAAGNFIAEVGTQNDEVAAARGNSDSVNPLQTGTSTRLALFDLANGILSPLTLSGAFTATGVPSDIHGISGQVIDRNAFVAAVDVNGTGVDSLVFAARDFQSSPSNPQIVIGLYSISENGLATLASVNNSGDSGTYRAGNQVGSYAVAAGNANGSPTLDLVADGPNAGVFLLNPSDGTPISSFTNLSILTGGVRLAAN